MLTVDQLKPGMVTCADIRDRSGRLLLGKGSAVQDQHIRLFRSWGVVEVAVESAADVASGSGVVETVIDPQTQARAEALVADRFRRADLDHPVIAELYRLAVAQQIKRFNGGD